MNIARKLRSTRARVAAATAAVLALSSLIVALNTGGPAVPIADGYGEGDGLNRFVVTLVDTPTAGGADRAPGGGAQPGEVRDGDPDTLSVPALARAQAELGEGGRLVASPDGPYYVTDAGSAYVGTGTPSPGGPDPAVVAPAPAEAVDPLEALRKVPGVVSVQRLSDGTVLVATRGDADDLTVLDEVVDVTESVQVPVAGADPSDPFFSQYGWNLRNTGSNAYQQTAVPGADVDAPTGWDVSQGQGVVVAVVDTGFAVDHPDLAGALWTNPTEACGSVDTNGNGKVGDCHGWNFYADSPDVTNGDMGSHGTTVAGVIGARLGNGKGSAGVAPGAVIMPLVVGGGESVDVYLAAEAIRYAADNGADVVNASFGGAFSGSALTALTSAVDYAISKGVVVVAAAGNDGKNRDSVKVYPANLTNPALITVASTTAADTLADTSAYGATSVDLAAPGHLVLTTWNDGGYRLVSGTSIAAPHVAAAAALHRALRPDLTPAQVRAAILEDAEPLPALAGKVATGARLTVGPLADSVTDVAYTFSQMVAPKGVQNPRVQVTSTSGAGDYQVRFGLAMLYEGQVWAVSGEDVTFGGQTATTDDDGLVTFPLGSLPILGMRTLEPQLTLGTGSFGLTVQVLKDGEPLTRPYAAPLLVTEPGTGGGPGTDPGTGPGGSDPGGSDPGTNPGGSDPGTNPGGGNPGGTTPPGSDPGTDPGGDNPGGGTPGGTTPPGSDPGTNPGGDNPGGGTPGGTTPPGSDPGTNPGGGNPGGGTPGGTTPPGSDPGGGNPGGSDPGTGPGPSDPTSKFFDRVGAFQITKVTPYRVSTAGGTVVTVRGDALEAGLSVRVGSTATAHVTASSPTGLVFQAPARVAGVYDVTIYKDGRTSVLVDALEYVAPLPDGTLPPGGNPGGSDPGTNPPGSDPGTGPGGGTPGGSDPGTNPGGGNPGGTTPPGSDPGTGPGGGNPPGSDPGTNPGGGNPGGTTPPGSDPGGGNPGGTTPPGSDPGGGVTIPDQPRETRIGPNGEHLVRSDTLTSLVTLWTMQCTATCVGKQV